MQCDTPYIAERNPASGMAYRVPVRCGKCVPCIKYSRLQWLFRLQTELRRSPQAIFATFTYNEKEIPYTDSGYYNLDYTDMQKFYKRVRKTQKKLKHFTVGEYGADSLRSHFHAIVFNADEDELYKQWTEYGKGHSHYDKCNDATMLYTLKYMDKRGQKDRVSEHWKKEVTPEMRRMSNGLGDNFIYNEDGTPTSAWYKIWRKELFTVALDDGTKLALPEYYVRKVHGDRKYMPEKKLNYIRKKFRQEENWRRQGQPIEERRVSAISARKVRHENNRKTQRRNKI